MPKQKKIPVTKLDADQILDGIRSAGDEKVFLVDGNLDGQKVTFVCAVRGNGDEVPLCLVLDRAGCKALDKMSQELDARREAAEGPGDEDDDEDESDDEDAGFEP